MSKYTIYRTCTILDAIQGQVVVAELDDFPQMQYLLKTLAKYDKSAIHTFWAQDEQGQTYSPYQSEQPI